MDQCEENPQRFPDNDAVSFSKPQFLLEQRRRPLLYPRRTLMDQCKENP